MPLYKSERTIHYKGRSERILWKIDELAQGVLDTRALYPENSLADLNAPLTMPQELQTAHR